MVGSPVKGVTGAPLKGFGVPFAVDTRLVQS